MGEHSRLMMQFASFLAQNNYPGLAIPSNSSNSLPPSANSPTGQTSVRQQSPQNSYQAAMITELARQLLDKASALSSPPPSVDTTSASIVSTGSLLPGGSYTNQNQSHNFGNETSSNQSNAEKRQTLTIGPHQVDKTLLPTYALKLMKPSPGRRKPGPKEKDSFGIYVFCLPDRHSKLPKFTSREPSERVLITKYQEQGYGYPPHDYFDTFSRKTQLCLTYTESKFLSFLVASFPVLEEKQFDLYRIDKQRRLIRLQSYTPRHIKEMKYQGTVVIIPYKEIDDRPPPIINRIGEEVVSSTFYTEFDTEPQSMEDTSSNELELNEREAQFCVSPTGIDPSCMTLPMLPSLSPTTKKDSRLSDIVESTDGRKSCSRHDPNAHASNETVNNVPGIDEDDEGNVFSTLMSIDFKQSLRRNKLKTREVRRVVLNKFNLVDDFCRLIRDESSLQCRLEFHVQSSANSDHQPRPAASILVEFWRHVFANDFYGRQLKIPKLNLGSASTTKFKLLGKVLAYGLIHCNYWPLKLSYSCTSFILCNQECSADLLISCLQGIVPIYEWQILENASSKLREREDPKSSSSEETNSLKDVEKILHWYGCDLLSMGEDMQDFLLQLSRFILICKPLWPLLEMKKGFESLIDFEHCSESDVEGLYKTLELNPFQIYRKINYIFSSDKVQQEMENVAKDNFERCLLRFSADELGRFFWRWTGYDCLGVECLYVQFSTDRDELISFSDVNKSSLSITCFPVTEDRLFKEMEKTI